MVVRQTLAAVADAASVRIHPFRIHPVCIAPEQLNIKSRGMVVAQTLAASATSKMFVKNSRT